MMVYLLAAGVAVLVSWLVIPPTVRLASAYNLLDTPDTERRLHQHAVPRLGGIGVWAGTASGLLCIALSGRWDPRPTPLWWAVLAGVLVMVVVGLIDDLRGLAVSRKLAAQCAAGAVIVAAGFRIDTVAVTGDLSWELGWLAVPLTMLWLVGVTNAFNLIDGLDGLAGGVALVGLATIGMASVLLQSHSVLAVVIPLGGSLIGFLRHNAARPSRIFLGDVGSLSVGFALAVLAVEGARLPSGPIVAVVPLFALAFPLLDTAIAMLRRWLRGVPLTSADGRHVHHQLVCLGLSRPRAAAAICLFSMCFAGLGLSLAFAPPMVTLSLTIFGGAASVLFVVHGLRWLGYHEFVEAQASFASGLFKARSVIRDRILARELDARLRNANSFAAAEMLLLDVVRTFGFERVCLADLASPADEPHRVPGRRLLRLDCPLHLPDGVADNNFVLRVWWHEDSRTPPLYAERIVRMLVPSLEAALAGFAGAADPRPVSLVTGEVPLVVTTASGGSRTRRLRGAAHGG